MKRAESTKSGISEAQSRKEMIVDDKEHTTEPVIKWEDVKRGKNNAEECIGFLACCLVFRWETLWTPATDRDEIKESETWNLWLNYLIEDRKTGSSLSPFFLVCHRMFDQNVCVWFFTYVPGRANCLFHQVWVNGEIKRVGIVNWCDIWQLNSTKMRFGRR